MLSLITATDKLKYFSQLDLAKLHAISFIVELKLS